MSGFRKPPIEEQFKDYGQEPPVKVLSVRSLGSYRAKRLKWQWPGWFPRGEVVVGEGMGGISKSTFLMDITARLTTGREMPDGQPHPTGDPVEVLWITNEDDPDTQLKPRLVAAGGDPDKVPFVTEDFTLPDDAMSLRRHLLDHPAIGVVVIDPLFSHMDDRVSTASDTEMRQRVMKPLKNTARECGVTIIVVRHFNKNTGQEVALRGSGSYGGIAGAARVVITVLTDPDDDTKERRVIGPTKSNYARLPMPLVFTVKSITVSIPEDDYVDELPAIQWLGQSEIDIPEAMRRWQAKGGTAQKERQNATDRDLRDILAQGPIPARDAKGEMGRRGYGKDATNAAADRLNVAKKKQGMDGPWVWLLPVSEPKDRPPDGHANPSSPSASSGNSQPLTATEDAEDAEEGVLYVQGTSTAEEDKEGPDTGEGPVHPGTSVADYRLRHPPCPPHLYDEHIRGVIWDAAGPGWLCPAGCQYEEASSSNLVH